MALLTPATFSIVIVFWLRQFNDPSHPQIQKVSFISPSGVVVEVGISLTRRPTHDEIDVSNLAEK